MRQSHKGTVKVAAVIGFASLALALYLAMMKAHLAPLNEVNEVKRIAAAVEQRNHAYAANIMRELKGQYESAGDRGGYFSTVRAVLAELGAENGVETISHDLRAPDEILFGLFAGWPNRLTGAERRSEKQRIAEELSLILTQPDGPSGADTYRWILERYAGEVGMSSEELMEIDRMVESKTGTGPPLEH